MGNQLAIRLTDEELEKIDSVRKDETRSGYATRLLRQLLAKNFERDIEKSTKIDKMFNNISKVSLEDMANQLNEMQARLGILTNTAEREYNFAEEDEINKRNIDSLNDRLQSLTDKFNNMVSKYNAHVESNSEDKKEVVDFTDEMQKILKRYENRFIKIFKVLNAELDLNARLKKSIDPETLEFILKFK
ncbi:MAG: hypothetical protein HPY53_12115 [Brevinematales bacterium]|nr:hypothetical protein [Brevinematales bacterium]